MPPFDNNIEPEEPDQFLPQPPQELPPTPDTSAPFATGEDQGAGQALELGRTPAPPAYRTPEAVPPGAETATPYSIEPPVLHYSGFEPTPTPDSKPETPSKPAELPPLPKVRNPGRERRRRMRAAKRAKSLSAVGDGELLTLAGMKEWNAKSTDLTEETGKVWEKAARMIAMQQSQLAMVLSILEDTRARMLEVERALASYTLPDMSPRGF